jgi:aspartate aminotransferase
MIPLADRVAEVADSITLAVSAKARAMKLAGVDVVGFGAGEPDFDTPQFIKDAAIDAIQKGQTKYTPTPCVPELKKAIAEKFKRENGLVYAADQVSTGAGGKQCLYMAFLAVLNPGDEVLIPSPYWVSYPEQVKMAQGKPVILPGAQTNGFKITPQQLDAAITPRTKVLVINSPGNPSGVAYTPQELSALAQVVAKHAHVLVFADEIYEKLVYDGLQFVSFANLAPGLFDRTLTFNCHSKSFAMTGWRLGYVAGPKYVIDAINKPGAAALNDPRGAEAVETMRQQFEQRGRHMWERLSALPGVQCVRPGGAFYCFPDVSKHFGKTSPNGQKLTDAISFSAALLDSHHVAVVPGNDSGFDTHVRLSFATSLQQIDKGIDRIAAFLAALT